MGFFNARIFGPFFSLLILTLQSGLLSGDFRGFFVVVVVVVVARMVIGS